MEEMDSIYRPGGLVFANESGGIINPSSLRNRCFKRLLEQAGLSPIRFHDLRHTCATLLLSRNVNPQIVPEMLGHSSISTTLDTHSHVLPTMQENAVRALEDALKLHARCALLHKGPGHTPRPSPTYYVFPANRALFRVDDSGLEPLTSSVSY
jgi:hypothetical protein